MTIDQIKKDVNNIKDQIDKSEHKIVTVTDVITEISKNREARHKGDKAAIECLGDLLQATLVQARKRKMTKKELAAMLSKLCPHRT